VIYSITITVDEPILPITDLKGVLVPTPTRDKLFVCHYFSISNPDLQPKAHTPSSRLDNGGEARFDSRKL